MRSKYNTLYFENFIMTISNAQAIKKIAPYATFASVILQVSVIAIALT